MFRTLGLFLLIVTISCSACQKTAAVEQPHFSVALLTAHSWKIKALLYRLSADVTNTDFTDIEYQDCEKDDVYTFATDSTFSRSANGTECDPPFYFGPSGGGTWSGNNDLTELTITAYTYHATFFVDELTSTSFIMEQHTTDALQNDIVYTYEFEPQ